MEALTDTISLERTCPGSGMLNVIERQVQLRRKCAKSIYTTVADYHLTQWMNKIHETDTQHL